MRAHPSVFAGDHRLAFSAGVALALAGWPGLVAGAGLAGAHAAFLGVLSILVAVLDARRPGCWVPWAYLALGFWGFEAPWLLGFESSALTAIHLVAGVLLAGLALWRIFALHPGPRSTFDAAERDRVDRQPVDG